MTQVCALPHYAYEPRGSWVQILPRGRNSSVDIKRLGVLWPTAFLF